MSISPARRTAVVTGASAGIGKATARMLAQRGWHVIGIGRDPERCAAAEQEIRAAAEGGQVNFLRADFTSMADVARTARDIAALTDSIDVLVNNAGGVRDQRHVTIDGLEATFAANHLAPFLLTRDLMPLLRAAARQHPVAAGQPASVRVLAVSSSGHEYCPEINWDDLQFERDFTTGGAYCQAKLANILFTRELNLRAGADGIIAQAMHPGVIASNFASHGDDAMQKHMASLDGNPPEHAAETLVWMALSDEAGVNGGRYFHNKAEAPAAAPALDDAAASRLWLVSEEILSGLGV